MSYCVSCGQLFSDGARFCTACGRQVVDAGHPVSNVTPAPTVIQVIKEKSGGWLAIKGFFVTLILFSIATSAVDRNDHTSRMTWILVSFLLGAIYITTSLRTWKRKQVPVSGTPIAWGMVILLAFGCFGALQMIWFGPTEKTASQTEPTPVDASPAADTAAVQPIVNLSPKEMKEARIRYAADVDKQMLDAGIESSTLAWGPDATTLQITYALAGRVAANELQKNLNFEELRTLGFKKVVLTNGLDDGAGNSFEWAVD
jgi:hypothetical protein